MKKKYLALSFIEGAAVMAAELCGARLLAPVFGSSLYVWASAMGITLGALAAGYFYGGRLSGRVDALHKNTFGVLIAAAFLVLLMPVVMHFVVPFVAYLPFTVGIVLSTTILLFLPVFFLGASSPLFIALQSTGQREAGRVSGTIYAISTAGGIVATFLSGFYLIPELGLGITLVIFGGLLFIGTLVVFRRSLVANLLLLGGALYVDLQVSVVKGGLFTADGLLGRVEVVDEVNAAGVPVRLLKVNSIVQTEMHQRTGESVSDYIALLDTLVQPAPLPKRALVLGIGGGLTANLFEKKNYRTDGVEFDGRIIDVARSYFGLNHNVVAINADARYYLNSCSKKYDLVLVDLFKAEEQPSHVITTESLERLKANLAPSAVLYINWHGYIKKMGAGTAILFSTLKHCGYQVQLCATGTEEDRRNLLFVATLHTSPPLRQALKELPSQTAQLNTDDHPLLEKYNASANKAWRTNYLRYYQSRD